MRALRRTRRWREIAGRETGKRAAISPALKSRRASASTILARVGSASAAKICMTIYVTYLLRNMQVTEGGQQNHRGTETQGQGKENARTQPSSHQEIFRSFPNLCASVSLWFPLPAMFRYFKGVSGSPIRFQV